MTQIYTFSAGDFYHQYGPQYVLSQLGVLPPSAPTDTTTIAALFMPSFHPECWICVQQSAEAASVTLVTLQTNLWYWGVFESQNNQWRGQPPDNPALWRESATLARSSFDQFLANVRLPGPEELKKTDSISCDGMQAIGYFAAASKPLVVFEDKPSRQRPKQFEFFYALYRLADRMLVQPQTTKQLERLHGYLSPGIPIKFFTSKPRTIRIFGSLSSDEKEELESDFDALADNQPLLIDMSNFDGMGTLLYPIFLQFSKRPGRTAWVASAVARKQLSEIGMTERCVFETVEDASAWLSASK